MPILADFILSFPGLDRIPEHFVSWIPGKTPLSSWSTVVSLVVTYLVVVFATHNTMKDKAPMKLTSPFRAHSLLLSVASLVLVIFIFEELLFNWMKPDIGAYGCLCSEKAWTKRFQFYVMLNYYFKYYELIDTIFLALKKKPLSFLHVYHHAATVVLTFVQLNHGTVGQWVTITLNLCVHVLMYYYYYAAAGGTKIWWKKHLTTMQITQFVLALSSISFVAYQHIAYNYFPDYLPHSGGCFFKLREGGFGFGIVFSYLILFIDFFYQTYKQKSESARSLSAASVASRLLNSIQSKHSSN